MSVRIAALLAVLAAALTLGAGAGAGTASQPTKIDLSSPAAIDAYLRSIGVDPATVVKQNGLKNYAGPNCPGAGWTCTTSTRVVQVSHENSGEEGQGENEFQCRGQDPANPATNPSTNTCVIVQSGTKNHAKCEEERSTEPLATQLCDITQSGKRNFAEIEQQITQGAGPSQQGEQTAKVNQDAVERNVSQIHQKATQKTSTGTSQTQDAFQEADVTQRVSGSENYSHVHQTQDQNESGAAAAQSQNTTPNSAFNCGNEKPSNPNQCVSLFQDATPGGGTNVSHLHQRLGERETSMAVFPTQSQGRFDGGQEGNVHQENPLGVGQNLNFPDQDLRQFESSPGTASQRQATDPGCCGVGSQIGGAKNREDIDQSTAQSASGTPFQDSSFFGQTHQVDPSTDFAVAAVAAAPDNQCQIEQTGKNNSGGATFSNSGTGLQCANLFLATQCVSPSEGAACFPASSCTEICLLASRVPILATFGRDIAMADYSAEPANYYPPSP